MAAIAMTAATLTACSSDELATKESPVQKNNVVTLTATLSPKGGDATTRSLSDPGDGTLTSTWAVNEEIEVLYEKSTDPADSPSGSAKATVTAVDGSGNATITVDLVSPKDGNTGVYFHYPYSIAKGTKDLKTDQIGTLDDIAANFDEVTGDGVLSVSGGVATLPANVPMTRNVCIWKLAFTNGGSPLTDITALNIKVGDIREIDVNPTIPLNEVYVAMYSCSGQEITISAATATGMYSFSKTGVSLTNGQFYRSTVAMSEAPASNTYREYTTRTEFDNVAIPGGAVTVESTTTTWEAGTYVVSSDVTINANVSVTGDAKLILKDGASLTVNGTITGGGNLSIYGQTFGTGKLDVIDNDINVSVENITIHGGIITVTEGGVIQGIETVNDFAIYHGKVTTAGGANGFMMMGDMHIYGGDITATSTNGQALLVSGSNGKDGSFTMTGGTFRAIGTGTGSYNKGIMVTDGNGKGTATITISGGTLIATGGQSPDDSNTGATAIDVCGTLTISGTANVTANGGTDTYATAGGGYGINVRTGTTAGGNATISGGTVTVSSGHAMAGLSIYDLTMSGGEVTIIGGSYGEGILANTEGSYPDFTRGTITINGGLLRSTGGENSSGLAGRIVTVTGGKVYAYGGDGAYGVEGTVDLTSVTMYEGDAANPATPATDQTACTKRYVIIQ